MNVQRQMYESQRNPAIPALKVFPFFIRISFFYNPWDETHVLWDEILTSSFRFQYVKELLAFRPLVPRSAVRRCGVGNVLFENYAVINAACPTWKIDSEELCVVLSICCWDSKYLCSNILTVYFTVSHNHLMTVSKR